MLFTTISRYSEHLELKFVLNDVEGSVVERGAVVPLRFNILRRKSAMYFLESIIMSAYCDGTNLAMNKPILMAATSTFSRSKKPIMCAWDLPIDRNSRCRRSTKVARQSTAKVREILRKRCLRCSNYYADEENNPRACSYHAHMNGDRGLFSMAPPHQGIDGEWTDASGVIVYKWNEKDKRPNTGRNNWKKRWSCCGEYDETAPPCRLGWHVSYDDGVTLF